MFGSVFKIIMNALSFDHAPDAVRNVIVQGAGLGDIAIDFCWVWGIPVNANEGGL